MRLHVTLRLSLGVCLASVAVGQDAVSVPATAAAQRPTAAPNQYIVVFTPGTPANQRASAATASGAQLRHNYLNIDGVAVTVPNANVLDALRRTSGVVRVVPDFLIHTHAKGGGGRGGTPPPPTPIVFDTRQLVSAEVQRVGMPVTGSDGSGIGVAVVDSGIDFTHSDLAPAPNAVATAFNATSPGASCQDDGGHGTHVSGLIAALNNGIAVVGVAPGATLYCVKVLGSDLTGTDSNLLAGLD
jgi:hypothetical protein